MGRGGSPGEGVLTGIAGFWGEVRASGEMYRAGGGGGGLRKGRRVRAGSVSCLRVVCEGGVVVGEGGNGGCREDWCVCV